MTGAFVFDGPLYCDCNGVYCNTTITNEMLERYFSVVDNLYLIIRTIHIPETFKDAHLKELILGENIKVIEIPNFLTPKGFFFRSKSKSKMSEIIEQIDLVFLRIPSVTSNMVADICNKINKPYFVEVGGCAWDSYWNHGIMGKLVAPQMFLSQRKVVKNASFASYVTEKWLQSRYPTNAPAIVASNVYLDEFDEKVINNRVSKITSFSSKRIKIGTIASVEVRYKGQEYIIRALSNLKDQGIIVDYELVGTGDPTFLKNLSIKLGVQDQVHFLGVKLHSDIWKWLDEIDIYAQPSKQEGLPRAVIEAMNRGCLTIGSDTAGIPELLENDTVFKSGSVKEIYKILLMIINEKNIDIIRRIKRNYNKSKEFQLDILEQRRLQIFTDYRKMIENEKR